MFKKGQTELTNGVGFIEKILQFAYGLTPLGVHRLPVGQATLNYKAECAEQTVFVKRYLPGTDLAAEQAAINLSVTAGKAGVPVAPLLPACTGEWITSYEGTALSVWEYIDGRIVTTNLNASQLQAIGDALGRIHCCFASLPESKGPQKSTPEWLAVDRAKAERTIDLLLNTIAERLVMSEFDIIAQKSLRERQAALVHVQPLVDGLPTLTGQIVHGDYSVINLLLTDNAVVAVLDFRPPNRYLIAYELGRIAFDPRFVVLNPDWISAARTLIQAYLNANPRATGNDVIYSARVWLIQLLMSLYGIKNHYLDPGLIQSDLDVFWQLRHQAVQLLLAHLDEVEVMLHAL